METLMTSVMIRIARSIDRRIAQVDYFRHALHIRVAFVG